MDCRCETTKPFSELPDDAPLHVNMDYKKNFYHVIIVHGDGQQQLRVKKAMDVSISSSSMYVIRDE